jgi:hypothetical protein
MFSPLTTLASTARWPEALAATDLARIAVELDGAFRRHGARTQPQPPDLLLTRGKLPSAAMATFVLEGERIARAVVTHIRVAPFFAGIALVVHPRAELEAPLLVADMTIAPTGRARALLDACGPSIAARGFAERFAAPLAQVVDGATGVRRSTVPAWLAPVSGAGGGQLRAGRTGGEGLARVLLRYVDRYLMALDSAPRISEASARRANELAVHAVRDVVRAHGPARKHLARSFGERTADRALRLLWREDAPAQGA